jgi:exonuclease SbcC
VDKLREEATALTAQLDATPVPVPPETAPDLVALESELRLRQEEQTRAAQGVGAAQARLDSAQAAASKAHALSVELSTAEVELADWTRLAADLGRKGLQAALVDSAGPELTRATNDLLHSCFGTRWTVTYETQRVNGNGGVSEGYDVRIIDTERGRDGVVEDLSDGERTIIGEAASLALTELACKRAGFDNPTLIRDESGAALSPEKRPMWVAMLRRAAQHVNADRVIVISHSEDVQELCDVRMRVADGKVTVES